MSTNQSLKTQIYNTLQELIELRITTAQKAIASAEEARDNETKSSVGDKYETGRAMMHLEKEKNQVQLSKAFETKKKLDQIDLTKEYHRADFGSLVITNNGKYFLSIGIGKLVVEEEKVFVISLESPLGKVLKGKQVGDQFNFLNKVFDVQGIC